MPRGQKSKLHARKKRSQARGHAQDGKDAKKTAIVGKESTQASKNVPAAKSRSTTKGPQKKSSSTAPVVPPHAVSPTISIGTGSVAQISIPSDDAISTTPSIGSTDADLTLSPASTTEAILGISSTANSDIDVSVAQGLSTPSKGDFKAPSTASTPGASSSVPSLPEDDVSVALSTAALAVGMSGTRPFKSVKFQRKLKKGPAQKEVPSEYSHLDLMSREVRFLEQFILYRFNLKRLTSKDDMIRITSQKYKKDFEEIFRKACEHLSAVFAVEVREVSPETYNLVTKLKLPNNGRVRSGRGYPKTGFVMNVLAMIFLKGNRAAEEDIWKFLKLMRVYPGKKHYIFGEPKKLITQDLVRLKYLEYRRMPNTDPPRYEFLWGPQAYAETSKMEVLQFLATVNETSPNFFASLYEEALEEQRERALNLQGIEPSIPGITPLFPMAAQAVHPVECKSLKSCRGKK
ncbi:melanoma-associated antigen B3-like [Perognathus longimembris pacificus]|uniref:melanoma-associated antigen B3-like n=1 Tax=Perognathus longimembris pacificus TaxID=214514 RepID=UPI0020188913|nr:melanoma-associated antigen B3-like [Perognathus longimembris pacificus]